MIDQLHSALRDAGVELTAEEVADALWLAHTLGPSMPRAPRAATGQALAAAGRHAATSPRLRADVTPMPSSIAFARALHPLLRPLGQEPGNGQAIPGFPGWQPAESRPRASFDLVLVVDDGISMEIWRPTAAQLTARLSMSGAFSRVHSWQIDTNEGGGEPPAVHHVANRKHHGYMAPVTHDRHRHQMIMVVSDCVGPAWQSGSMARVLQSWARVCPTAIVQVLPPRLWASSALSPERVTWLATRAAGLPNMQMSCKKADTSTPVRGIPVPVLGLDARSLGAWAQLVSGAGIRRSSGLAYIASDPGAGTAHVGSSPVADAATLSAVDRMSRFSAFASPDAMHLAECLAAAGPLTLPVMRLVQREVLPDSVPGHLAEVYLGGLLQRVAGAPGGTSRYEFYPGVRDLLFSRLTRTDSIRVVRMVSDLAAAAIPVTPVSSARDEPSGRPSAAEAPARYESVAAPGLEPVIWGMVPARNPNFTGREEELIQLRRQLMAGGQATLTCTLHGLGGVGKTQIAIEYAHRFRGSYELVWWVPAQQPTGIWSSLSQLSQRLDSGGSLGGEAWARALDALRTGRPCERWLLIYDNADRPQDLDTLVPQGNGHVIITSRNAAWSRRGSAIDVGPLAIAESIELLHRHGDPGRPLSDSDAARIAEVTGRLPIALVQAAGWQADMGMTAEQFARQFEDRLPEILSDDQLPPGYPASVFATWQLAIERLGKDDPGAVELLELCSLFAPEPIHRSLLAAGARLPEAAGLTGPLGEVLRDEWSFTRALRSLRRYALAQVDRDQDTIEVHRLIQAAVRRKGMMREDRRTYLRHVVHLLLLHACAGIPANPTDPRCWQQRGRIQPHLIPSEALNCEASEVRTLVLDQASYLTASGDRASAHKLGLLAWQLWTVLLGPGHADTIAARDISGLSAEVGRPSRA